MKHCHPEQQGFTLLELIVAVSILAVVAVLSWRGLDSVLRTRDSLNVAQERIDDLQRSFNRIERDALLAQDVKLFDGGRIRLLAANDTAVEYRLEGETLSRRVLTPGQESSVQDQPTQQPLLYPVTQLQADVYRRGLDGSAAWAALQASNTTDGLSTLRPVGPPTPVSIPTDQTVSRLPGMPSAGTTSNTALPGLPAPASNPSGLTGLRIMLQLKQGGTIQRLFLLGASS